MLLRRTTSLAIALLVFACEPSVPYSTANNPSSVDYAGFDPTGSPPSLPQPNDLALTDQAILSQNPTQAAVLQAFKAAGGFPNDQEVPITIDFVRFNIDSGNGAITRSAPPIDVTTINDNRLLLLSISNTGGFTALTQCSAPGPNCYDAPKAADYGVVAEKDSSGAVVGQHGTLTLHKSPNPKTGSRRWDPGQYIVAIRGGPSGVLVTGSTVGLRPQAAMYLLITCTPTCANGRDLTDRFNQGLIPGNSPSEKANNAAQLEIIRKSYLGPFAAIDATGKFNHSEVATLGTFKIADVHSHVETDPSAGLMPLPSDFLSGPDGHLSPEVCASSGPFGPLGPGLCTVDGFSTTAMILSQTSSTIDASTVNKDTVFLYEISGTSAVRKLDIVEALTTGHPEKTQFVDEPTAIAQTVPGATCGSSPPSSTRSLSTAIGLQPAVPARVGATFVPVPPLKEATTYVVLVTDGVQDINCTGLTRSTLAKLVLLDPKLPLSDASGKSLVVGPTDAQAVGLDKMRAGVNLAIATLAAEKSAITRDHIAMAYTFHTQSITGTAVSLGALPYSPACSSTVTSNCFPSQAVAALSVPVASATTLWCKNAPSCANQTAAGTVNDVYDTYAVDRASVPTGNIGFIMQSVILTPNLLDPATGAFLSDPSKLSLEPIPVIISVPGVSSIPSAACIGAGGTPPCLAPLAVFRHGVNGSRATMLALADRLNNAGIVVAAIDAAKHGARSFCHSVTNAECVSGSSCLACDGTNPYCADTQGNKFDFTHQGDTPTAGGTPGKCSGGTLQNGGNFVNGPVVCPGTGCPTAFANGGAPIASGNYFVSGNLFRTRDSLRQDIIDQSQLIHVLAVNPQAPPTGADIFNKMAATGVIIDPTRIYYIGQSLGGIQGDVDVAANPRITKALFNVSGETIVDTYTNSPALGPALNALLATLGITPGTPAYLQFVNVAKWILDPADPANFSDHLTRNTLPNLLKSGLPPPLNSDPMVPKKILGQMASCDNTVPNPFNLLQFDHVGLGVDTGGATGTLTTFVSAGTVSTSCPGGVVKHGFLADWITYGQSGSSITLLAQDDAAAFFLADTHPPPQRAAP